jgi:SPP1 gp7 family putative phage head morphogenesis protein
MPTEKQKAKAAQKAARMRWQRARIAEREYARALINVGRHVGNVVSGFARMLPSVGRRAGEELDEALRNYASLITPWATRVTQRMHAEVGWRDLRAWTALSRTIGRNLSRELTSAPTGAAFHALLAEQVNLIKSIPLEAAQRVHERTKEALVQGTRFADLIPEIMETGKVAQSKARLIARTETARTSSVLTQVRAQAVGSDGYIWRTAEDAQVRPDHARLNGTLVKWSEPPLAGSNMRYHAGQGPNCRCYPEPILPD